MEKDLLLIDDDFDLSEITYDYLTDHGFSVEVAHSIKQAKRAMEHMTFKLIILDINLPDGLGFDFCKDLRKVSNIPIIFISARTSQTDRITGLDIGGDDYMPKPYSLDELQSRIKANLRRWYSMDRQQEQTHFEQDELKVDIVGRKVYVSGALTIMTVKEFDVLVYLIRHKGKVITKETLYHAIWGHDSIGEISTISVHIRWLREKIERDPSKPRFIKTIWGKGYIFE
ncbi:response regulator transcription factor [Vallitalea pronyensis]|uniref:Stage 0 sporulation protein A homolog n=1 Tax=Vallitalea pronyensis TaxID=1348613 RepID=A0A8J8MG20_9FIRM|nr:response regulator transcription factor [Vallitalea pronyensis]QUI20806.1 response regulator transcription factor [Vallitalea pronyensis]